MLVSCRPVVSQLSKTAEGWSG